MRLSHVITRIVPAALALMMLAGPARAEHEGWPCRQDIQALCPDITPGPEGSRDCLAPLCPDLTPGPASFVDCLLQAGVTLSDQCRAHLNTMQAKIAAWQQACGGDVPKFCSDVTRGPWSTTKCLREHQSALSQACQDLLAQQHGHHHHDCQPTPTPGP